MCILSCLYRCPFITIDIFLPSQRLTFRRCWEQRHWLLPRQVLFRHLQPPQGVPQPHLQPPHRESHQVSLSTTCHTQHVHLRQHPRLRKQWWSRLTVQKYSWFVSSLVHPRSNSSLSLPLYFHAHTHVSSCVITSLSLLPVLLLSSRTHLKASDSTTLSVYVSSHFPCIFTLTSTYHPVPITSTLSFQSFFHLHSHPLTACHLGFG